MMAEIIQPKAPHISKVLQGAKEDIEMIRKKDPVAYPASTETQELH